MNSFHCKQEYASLKQNLYRIVLIFPGQPFRAQVCTVPSSMDRTSRCNKVDAVRLYIGYASYRLNLLLLKGQICVKGAVKDRTCPSINGGSLKIMLTVP